MRLAWMKLAWNKWLSSSTTKPWDPTIPKTLTWYNELMLCYFNAPLIHTLMTQIDKQEQMASKSYKQLPFEEATCCCLLDLSCNPGNFQLLEPESIPKTRHLGNFHLSQAIDDRFVWSKMKGLRKEDSKEHPTTQSKPYVRVWMYFLRQKHHISLMSFSVTAFRTCFSSWMNSTL